MSAEDHVFMAGLVIGGFGGLLAGILFVRVSDYFALRSAVRQWEQRS